MDDRSKHRDGCHVAEQPDHTEHDQLGADNLGWLEQSAHGLDDDVVQCDVEDLTAHGRDHARAAFSLA